MCSSENPTLNTTFQSIPSSRLIFVRSERLGMFRRARAFLCGENVSRGISESRPDKGEKRKGKKTESRKGRNDPAGKGGSGLPLRCGNGPEAYGHKKALKRFRLRAPGKTATTYSPTIRSTIGVTKLNFSVRNGKRWNLRAIVT